MPAIMEMTPPKSVQVDIPNSAFLASIPPHTLDFLRDFDDSPQITRRVVVWHRRARKTTMGVNLLLRECMRNQNATYAHIFPTFRQAKAVLWRDPMMIRRYMPKEILKKPFNESELMGEFQTGSVLHIGGADDPERWRGMGCRGWILDEFAKMRNGKMLYEEIIYPIIRENGGWVIFLYTPKGRNHGWEFFQKAKQNPTWKSWFLPVTKSGVLTAEEIAEAQREMPAHLFAQEMMCEFLDAGGGVIKRVDEAMVGALQKPQKGQRYVMGVDLGKHEDFTVLTILNRQTRHVDAFERFQHIDWGFQKERIARMSKKWNTPLIVLDSTGIGDVVEDDLKRLGLSVRGFRFSSTSKRQLIEKLIIAVEDRRITYPGIEVLVDELKDFDIDDRGRYGAPSGLHDDCVISLALAVEGLGAEMYGGSDKVLTSRQHAEIERRKQKERVDMGLQYV